jgi:thiol-disulfide isomerase/thioredoxin
MTSTIFSNNPYFIFIIFIIILLFLYFLYQRNENFNNDKNYIKIYNFNAAWCGHCMHFKPTWNKFINSLEPSDNIKAISVNCEDNQNLDMIKKYKVLGFPTIIIEKDDGFDTYSGPRTVNGLRQALNLNVINDSDEKKNYNDIKINTTNKTKIYNFNTSWCGYSVRFQPIWDKFMKENTNTNINIIDVKCDDKKNSDLCKKYDVPGYPTVVKDGPNGVEIYEGSRTIEGLKEFASK